MTQEVLDEVNIAASSCGLSRTDWLSTAVEAVIQRGLSPIEYAARPDVEGIRALAVAIANAGMAAQFALAQLEARRVTKARRNRARDAALHGASILTGARSIQ